MGNERGKGGEKEGKKGKNWERGEENLAEKDGGRKKRRVKMEKNWGKEKKEKNGKMEMEKLEIGKEDSLDTLFVRYFFRAPASKPRKTVRRVKGSRPL
jgi:hypothetical protein